MSTTNKNRKTVLEYGFRARRCPQCNKLFYCYQETWVYTRQPSVKSKMFFCTWSCLNAWDKQHEKEIKQRKEKRMALARKKRMERIRNENRKQTTDI